MNQYGVLNIVIRNVIYYTRFIQKITYLYTISYVFSDSECPATESESDTTSITKSKILTPTIYITDGNICPIFNYLNMENDSPLIKKTYFTYLFGDRFKYSYEMSLNLSKCNDKTMNNICVNLFQEIYMRLCSDIPEWDPQESPINIMATQCAVPIVHNLIAMLCEPDQLDILIKSVESLLAEKSIEVPTNKPSICMIKTFISINGNVKGILLFDDLVHDKKSEKFSKEVKTGLCKYLIYQLKEFCVYLYGQVLKIIIKFQLIVRNIVCNKSSYSSSSYSSSSYDVFLKMFIKDFTEECVINYLSYNSTGECVSVNNRLKSNEQTLENNNVSMTYIISNTTIPITIFNWYTLYIPVICCNPLRYILILLHHLYISLLDLINNDQRCFMKNGRDNSTNGLVRCKDQESPFSTGDCGNSPFKNIYIQGVNTTEFTKNIYVDLPWEMFNTNLYSVIDYIITDIYKNE
tara:strand:- start:2500 stop:3891 length:1392 start_codon:yes stop_codon:yes gene_type:complete